MPSITKRIVGGAKLQGSNHMSHYRSELDGVRALAVIFVIINHFSDKILPSGFLGVDMFFVLSGYVVSASLYERATTKWYVFLSQFYIRRLKRIFPALIFCVLITGFIGCFFIRFPDESLKSGVFSLLGISNIYFYSHSRDYFGEDARHNLFTHTWSLGIEEQFYLLFPLLLVFIGFKAKRTLGGTLLLLCLASFFLWIKMTSLNPFFSFFMIFTRFWELGLGCITFLLVSNPNLSRYARTSTMLAFIALLLIVSMVFMPKQSLLISNTTICLAVVALIFFMRNENSVVRMLSNTWMVRIGILSYSLYLWHWPVISLSRYTVGINGYTIFFQVILIIVLSIFSYKFIEQPFRYGKIGGKSIANNKLALLTVASIVISCLFLFTLKHIPNRWFWTNKPRFDMAKPVFLIHPQFHHCENSKEVIQDEFPPRCYYSAGAKRTLWMLGDSTTWALKSFASHLVQAKKVNVAMYADDSSFPSARIFASTAIRAFFDKSFNYIIKWSKPGDIVFITANLGHEFCHSPELYCIKGDGKGRGWIKFPHQDLTNNEAFYEFLEEMGDLKRILEKKNVRLVISAPLPQWEREHIIYCEKQWYRPSWIEKKCQYPSYSQQKKSRARLVAILNEAQNKYGFYVYDPFPVVCNKTACNFSDPKTNENYWIDETHLSTLGGIRLAPDFDSFLQSNGLYTSHHQSYRI